MVRLGYLTTSEKRPTQSYCLMGMSIVPYDVRVEASVFAEEGSFFVLPGRWWNENPQDNRLFFEERVKAFKEEGKEDPLKAAQEERYRIFGTSPEAPFYHEPLNIRITLLGSITENMPALMSQQAEWMRKWGWMPGAMSGTGKKLPVQHVPSGYDLAKNQDIVPNLMSVYDSILYEMQAGGEWIRKNSDGDVLPPMPRLPVSPTLLYYGEIKP